MTRYKFLAEAEDEMKEAARFYESRSKGLGLNFLQQVEQTVASIVSFPHAGVRISENVRRRIVRRFPFGVLYAIDDDQIVVVAVAHLNRHPGYWKERN